MKQQTINHIITAHDLHYSSDQRHQELYDLGREAERTLNGYINYVWKQKQGQSHYGARYIVDNAEDTPSQPPAE